MPIDLDRYYTPAPVARSIMESCALSETPLMCADSTCGSGHLLLAANEVYPGLQCVGIDKDRSVINKLRREHPSWILSVGDLLNHRSYLASCASMSAGDVDFLVLNPPFSQVRNKYVEVIYKKQLRRASVAMACILRSLDNFDPCLGGVAIVPESLLHSELDAQARRDISSDWKISEVCQLGASTFKGARAHAAVIKFTPGSVISDTSTRSPLLDPVLRTKLIRGGLPVHEAVFNKRGIPFIHTTDLTAVGSSDEFSKVRRVKPYMRGVVSGWIVLVPRVSVPDKDCIRPLYAASSIQMSDCVMAICCENLREANSVVERILRDWSYFYRMYRGTGARYITVSHLANFLSERGMCSL